MMLHAVAMNMKHKKAQISKCLYIGCVPGVGIAKTSMWDFSGVSIDPLHTLPA